MSKDLIPLFTFRDKDGSPRFAEATVKREGETYVASSFISQVAEAIEEEAKALSAGKKMGELTIAAHLLLEILHKVGMQKTAEELLESPQDLIKATMWCAFGLRAGMQIPDGIAFETEETSNLSLREITGYQDPS